MTVDDLIAREMAVANQALLAKEVEAFRAYELAIADADLAEETARNLLAEKAGELERWRRQALTELHARLAETIGAGQPRH